jgi:hypothetical protein
VDLVLGSQDFGFAPGVGVDGRVEVVVHHSLPGAEVRGGATIRRIFIAVFGGGGHPRGPP